MINIHFSKDDYDDSDIGYTRYELVSLEFLFFFLLRGSTLYAAIYVMIYRFNYSRE
jgi:hypothetical protein